MHNFTENREHGVGRWRIEGDVGRVMCVCWGVEGGGVTAARASASASACFFSRCSRMFLYMFSCILAFLAFSAGVISYLPLIRLAWEIRMWSWCEL